MGSKFDKLVGGALSIATLGASDIVKGALIPPKSKLPAMAPATETAPVADDEALKKAAERKASRRKKAGRAGTMLTEESNLG